MPSTSASSSSPNTVPLDWRAKSSMEFWVNRAGFNRPPELNRGEVHTEIPSCCPKVLPQLVGPDRSIPQVSSSHNCRIGPTNPLVTPNIQCRQFLTLAAASVAACQPIKVP